MFNLIAAHDRNFAIGKNGDLPWYFTSDLKHFSKTTRSAEHNIVVMGKNTWNSIPTDNRPLQNRVNIIISSTLQVSPDEMAGGNVHVCPSFDTMLQLIDTLKKKKDNKIVHGRSKSKRKN